MTRKMLTLTVASAAMLVATPVIAHPGGRAGGGLMDSARGAAAGAGAASRLNGIENSIDRNLGSRMENSGAAGRFSDRIQSNEATRITSGGSSFGAASRLDRQTNRIENSVRSQGFAHASPNGILHAGPNSAVELGGLPAASLPGLTTGLAVQTTSGGTLGTVTNVLTTRNGMIAGVIVTATNGQSYRIPAAALSISGNVLTANTANGFGTRVPSALLPGLATGLTVNSSMGGTLGTITGIQTTGNGSVRTVTVTGANGQTYQVPANALSISGNTVTVNTAEAFERAGVPSSLLPGLTTGLTVDTSAGAAFGTVSRVITLGNGNITGVVVTSANGQTYQIPASSLSVSGNVVTVANAAEAFERTGVPSAFLPGLTTGLPVNNGSGTSLGTISQVIMGMNGTVAGVVVTSANGQTFQLPATDLSISGTTVTAGSATF